MEGISMTMSSCGSPGRRGLAEGAVVTQECPQYVDEAPGQGGQGLGVNAVLGAFALVEGLGWAVCPEAGQRGHVEDPAQGAVVAAGPAPVAGDAAGVFGDGHEPGVGGGPAGGG